MSATGASEAEQRGPLPTDRDILAALARLADGGLVAFPSETVWGLAACARREPAVAALRRWKGRDAEQPISLLLAGRAALDAHGFELSEPAEQLIRAFWPGPLTLVLPCSGRFAEGIARSDGAVGVRCSSHPLAARLAREAELAGMGPLTATSLNRSEEPPASSEEAARALCGCAPGAPLVLAAGGEDAAGEPPTTVVDLTASPPRILRVGGIGLDALRAAAGVEFEGLPRPPRRARGEQLR